MSTLGRSRTVSARRQLLAAGPGVALSSRVHQVVCNGLHPWIIAEAEDLPSLAELGERGRVLGCLGYDEPLHGGGVLFEGYVLGGPVAPRGALGLQVVTASGARLMAGRGRVNRGGMLEVTLRTVKALGELPAQLDLRWDARGPNLVGGASVVSQRRTDGYLYEDGRWNRLGGRSERV